MMFMGMFMLFVLPLFLVVCGRMLSGSKSGGTKFFGILMYLFALLSILGSIMILIELFN